MREGRWDMRGKEGWVGGGGGGLKKVDGGRVKAVKLKPFEQQQQQLLHNLQKQTPRKAIDGPRIDAAVVALKHIVDL